MTTPSEHLGVAANSCSGGFPAYLYSFSCSLTAERRRTAGMSEGGERDQEGERERERAGCQDESVVFVCCKESWDIKDDRT